MSKTRYLSKLTNGKGETIIVWDLGKTGGYNYEVTKADKKHTPFKKYTDTSIEDVYKDLKKMGYKKVNESITKAELKNIIRETLIEGNIISEAKAPTHSLYGIIEKYLWPKFLAAVKKEVKGGTNWTDNKAISMSIYMATFEGYTTSDVSFDGTISAYVDKDAIDITVTWNDASKGGNKQEWSVKHYEDMTVTGKEIGKFLETWRKV